MFRKPASKPVPVAPQTVVALNDFMKGTPYFFSTTSKGNLQFFRRYDYPLTAGHTCPRSEVENYMYFVMKMPLDRAIDHTFIAIARSEVMAQA
jgi:hypothetical protein